MASQKREAMLEAGAKPLSFELQSITGASASLKALLEKGPAVFAFFKVGCPVCQLVFPFLERMASGSATQMIGISQDDRRATSEFNDRLGVTFPTLLDDPKAGYPVSNAFGISSVPSIFLIEQSGAVAKSFTGFSKHDLEMLGERMGVQPFRLDDKVPEFRAG